MKKFREQNNENIDKIKIFSSEDEKLKKLGELLSNQSSRDIIKLLIEKEMYTKEIADKLDLRVNLVIHHLKKLEELELLQIENKEITKKGIDHKHYRINPYFFLAPSGTEEEIQKKGTLKKIFKDGIKFMVVGIGSLTSYFISHAMLKPSIVLSRSGSPALIYYEYQSVIVALSIIIIGLIVILIKKRKKS